MHYEKRVSGRFCILSPLAFPFASPTRAAHRSNIAWHVGISDMTEYHNYMLFLITFSPSTYTKCLYACFKCNVTSAQLLWTREEMERERKIKYTTVHIPSVLAGLIDDILEREEFAYSSRSEFIKDAIRRFLEYYGYYPRKKTSFKRYEEYPELPRHIEVATPRPNEDSTKQL